MHCPMLSGSDTSECIPVYSMSGIFWGFGEWQKVWCIRCSTAAGMWFRIACHLLEREHFGFPATMVPEIRRPLVCGI